MGTMSDIADITKEARGGLKSAVNQIQDLTGKTKYSSLAKKASEGTLQFPIIISASIDLETAQMVTKAMERNYSTFAQIAFSMSPTMRYHDGVTATEYLKKFHQNSPKMNMLELVSREAANLVDSIIIEDENYVILGATYEGTTNRITANNKEQLVDLLEHVRQDSLNNRYIPRDTNLYNFKDAETNARFNSIVKEADDGLSSVITYGNEPKNADSRKFEIPKNILTDNDVRKANELIATTLHIRVHLINDNGDPAGMLDFIVGIKGIMHPVKSEEMITNVLDACKNKGTLFNFLRWTTGEISFFKDFLFNIKEMKQDIIKDRTDSSPWWLAMKRRRELSKMNNSVTGAILPNSSIVMSAEEVAFIKSEYGYDLNESMRTIRKIMEQYYLLGFAIVDNASQYVKFLYDGDIDFQTVSFSALERAGSNDERKFKEMLKAMNRV